MFKSVITISFSTILLTQLSLYAEPREEYRKIPPKVQPHERPHFPAERIQKRPLESVVAPVKRPPPKPLVKDIRPVPPSKPHIQPIRPNVTPNRHRPIVKPQPRPTPIHKRPTIYHYQPHHKPGFWMPLLPSTALFLSIGGLSYYYASDTFYKPYNNGYIVVAPPAGVVIRSLPLGYATIIFNGLVYYVYEDVYYLWDDVLDGYRVVETPDYFKKRPPLPHHKVSSYKAGDIVDRLPHNARKVIIDSEVYYEYGNVYFMPSHRKTGTVYIVVNVR